MAILLDGYVDENGNVIVEGQVDLPPGKIRVEIHQQPMVSRPEEIKAWMQEVEENGLPDSAWEQADKNLDSLLNDASDDLGLPADYADEIDHYLYGTPRRSKSQDI